MRKAHQSQDTTMDMYKLQFHLSLYMSNKKYIEV